MVPPSSCFRLFSRRVTPVDTRSRMMSALPMAGAASSAPAPAVVDRGAVRNREGRQHNRVPTLGLPHMHTSCHSPPLSPNASSTVRAPRPTHHHVPPAAPPLRLTVCRQQHHVLKALLGKVLAGDVLVAGDNPAGCKGRAGGETRCRPIMRESAGRRQEPGGGPGARPGRRRCCRPRRRRRRLKRREGDARRTAAASARTRA